MSLWHCNFGPHTKSLSPVCPGLCCFCQCFRALNDDLGRKCRGVKLEAFSPPSKSMQRKSHHKDTHRMKNYVSSFTVSTVSTVYHVFFGWISSSICLHRSFPSHMKAIAISTSFTLVNPFCGPTFLRLQLAKGQIKTTNKDTKQYGIFLQTHCKFVISTSTHP